MTTYYRSHIVEALVELADASYQERVWAGDSPSEASDFTECVERLFDDSGLAIALTRGSVFGPSVDDQLRLLGRLVDSVDAGQPVGRLLQDPALADCRLMAAETLRALLASEVEGSGG